MRYLMIAMLILVLLVWLWPSDDQKSTSDTTHALSELLAALAATFRWYAVLDHALQESLWQALSGDLLPLLGALKCLHLLLTLWGIYALRLLGRLSRRVMGR